ncbi:hypothetical protein DSM104443_02773 [Usitatibacter rugosus]|uniref:Uncharacterized protein n=1 Tax=Usitatibacter rugosus TaxID=2732067 RepID=A0A6M4GWL8_9PROT|nr:hypothetical protein DSM104443_02773 [Usitatibacter rugosus]
MWAAKLGLAETLAYEVTDQIASWQSRKVSPELEPWLQARDQLESAQRLARRNGAVEELLGVLYSERRRNPDFQQLALDHFTAALTQRPSSPYTWASIADVRYRLGSTTGDYEQVLLNAVLLGPNEPEVQRIVVDYGFALWDDIGPETKAAVLQAIASGMRRNPMEMLKISERRGRLSLACPRVPSDARFPDPLWAKLCEANT